MWKNREFGEKLRMHRGDKGLTQSELGQLAGVSERTIRSLEKGRGTPSCETLYRLADGLSVAVEEIMPEQGEITA